MHDPMFEHQHALEDGDLAGYADQAGGSGAAVLAALAEGTYTQRVRDSFRNGIRAGVNGTPTLFIDGIRYDGARDEATLVAALELVTAEAGK